MPSRRGGTGICSGVGNMKRLVVGILAHVDSGKTTLSEAMLYRSGAVRKLGRVDHRDAFLDTEALERARGITIFAKQAVLTLPCDGALEQTTLTLLDTPGHVDFSAEAERTLQVLDYAILVVSGTDGVQSHTATLWQLLARYRVPTFIFVNKTDLPGADCGVRLRELQGRLSEGCVDFTAPAAARAEALALCSEPLMEQYLAGGVLCEADIVTAIARRQVFPCYFGAALRLDGVEEFLAALQRYTRAPAASAAFGAQVFKISTDEQGARLTHLKVTGGVLRVKDVLTPGPDAHNTFAEKADQLRIYSGAKFQAVPEALPGTICAVTGLASTAPGQGLGVQRDAAMPLLEPVLTYTLLPQTPEPDFTTRALRALRILEQEDPQLHVVWNDALSQIHLQLMGEVQLEILQSVLQSRFGLAVGFDPGGILYKETLCASVAGVGHYEPLRHYAEVHLLLEPGERGSGIQLSSNCREEVLDKNWQRLILSHLAERTHPGVLAGAPLTDVKITLTAGRAHQKHTEGGDFRQATYRAVRQGLRSAAAKDAVVLLEPWYDFRLDIPADNVGRAMVDLQRRCASFEPPETGAELTTLTGRAPVATMRGYAQEVAAYTHGTGRLSCVPGAYAPCHNAEQVLTQTAYNPDADLENPADSVFCSHGAGYTLRWDEVPARAHVGSGLARGARGEDAVPDEEADQVEAAKLRRTAYRGTLAQDKELLEIFERTYGPVRRRGEDAADAAKRAKRAFAPAAAKPQSPAAPAGPEYLLVDGYNVIFAWEELREIAAQNLETARRRLMDILCNYAAYRLCVPIVVFDAYKVKGGARAVERYHNLHVVYTREAETADMYIERATHQLTREHRVRVVSSDGAEQMIILGNGALRVSARAFAEEVAHIEREIREFLSEQG